MECFYTVMDTYYKTFQIFCTPLIHLNSSTSKGSLTMPEHQQIEQSRKPDPTFQKQATPASRSQESNPSSIIQRARINPKSMTSADVLQLQRSIGNRAVGELLSGTGNASTAQQAPVQREESPEKEEEEEEEPIQGKMIETIQRQEPEEEEEPIQGKMIETIQREESPEEKEPLQEVTCPSCSADPVQREENRTGMPDNLKAGLEQLSGTDLSDVKVHRNSSKPEKVGALAYTQGKDIHVGPGQEKHLPHEGWHAVQQAQGRVKPTVQTKGVAINDDEGLEREADVMGKKAAVPQGSGSIESNH